MFVELIEREAEFSLNERESVLNPNVELLLRSLQCDKDRSKLGFFMFAKLSCLYPEIDYNFTYQSI